MSKYLDYGIITNVSFEIKNKKTYLGMLYLDVLEFGCEEHHRIKIKIKSEFDYDIVLSIFKTNHVCKLVGKCVISVDSFKNHLGGLNSYNDEIMCLIGVKNLATTIGLFNPKGFVDCSYWRTKL